MKPYIIYCVKSFDCVIEGKKYHCVRAFVGELEKTGSTYITKSIKMIKCSSDFVPRELNKPCYLYFSDTGKCVASDDIHA